MIMNSEELKVERTRLINTISMAVEAFEKQTGLTVNHINVERTTTHCGTDIEIAPLITLE